MTISDGESDVIPLPQLLTDYRSRGMTWAQIEAKTGISAEEAAQKVHEYLASSYGAETVAVQRMLMLNRLERVVGALWDQVMQGDLLTEGKQTKNLIDTLTMIANLLDLNKDRVRDELVQLTKAQTELVHTMLAKARQEVLEGLLDLVQRIPTEGTPDQVKATVRNQLEAGFSAIYADAASRALESSASAVVTVNGESAENGTYGDEKITD